MSVPLWQIPWYNSWAPDVRVRHLWLMTRLGRWLDASCRDGRWWQPNATDHTWFIKGWEVTPTLLYWGSTVSYGRELSRPHTGRGGLLLWRPRAGRAAQTAHGATRPSNATPERSALKTTPVIGAPRHDRARGRNPPGWVTVWPWLVTDMSGVIVYMFVPSHWANGPVLYRLNDWMRWRY
jgi:hypothetical protein